MSQLPEEIWLCIVNMLIMPELREISRTCKHFRDLCAKRLQEQQRIAKEHFRFDIYDQKKPLGTDFVLHQLLFSILRGDFSATYIFEFDCGPEINYQYRFYGQTEQFCKLREDAGRLEPTIEDAVRRSPWIEEQERRSCVEAICDGNEDAVLCLLVPLLTNLRAFKVPMYGFFLRRTLYRIAQASASTTVEISSLPLQKLVIVISEAKNGNEDGPELDNLVVYAAIPSVRRLVAVACFSESWGGRFQGWPEDLPLSNATEVLLDGSCVVPADILPFAAGFAGPCVMRQIWSEHGSWPISGERGDEWNYLEIIGSGVEREIKTPEYRENSDAGIIMQGRPCWNEVFETNVEDWRPLVWPER